MTEQIDMSRFVEAKSDQLNADDLIGASRTLTVTRVTGSDGDQPIAIHYEGDNGKPFKPCKTIRRVLLAVWGRYANEYVGRTMRVYRDDAVTFGGLQVGGIRISHMSHIDKETTVVVMKSKGKKAGMKILPLTDAPAAEFTIEQARADIAGAATLDDLRTAWSRKIMAPFRDDLQADLDARKAELTPPEDAQEGPAETDRGEAPTLDQAREEIDGCELVPDVNARVAALDPLLSDEDGEDLRQHAIERIAALKAGN